MPIVANNILPCLCFRVGGTYHYSLKAPEGTPMWGKFTFREIIPQQKLVFISSFSDTRRHHAPSSA